MYSLTSRVRVMLP